MLTVKDLIANTQSHRARLISNAGSVGISFGRVEEGKDARGYYRSVKGRALSKGKGKKQKTFEIRLYYPKPPAKVDQYIPSKFRVGKYLGPEKAPDITIKNKVWVFCTCEYFLFHCEVADAEQDNSTINAMPRDFYSNGERFTQNNGKFPSITNPGGVGHVCKHLIAALRKGALLKK